VVQKVDIDLENSKRAGHLARYNAVTDVEVKEQALRLRAPILIVGHFDLAH
jgi:hypothetical protein